MPRTRSEPERRPRGRPHNSGPFGQPTTVMRIPVSVAPVLRAWVDGHKVNHRDLDATPAAVNPPDLHRPLLESRASCGFPSPADDYAEDTLDLNQRFVHNPVATFFMIAEGQSMIEYGIHDGDLLIVDRSVEPRHQSVVVAIVENDRTVKILDIRKDGSVWLMPGNSANKGIQINEDSDIRLWGVVTGVAKDLR